MMDIVTTTALLNLGYICVGSFAELQEGAIPLPSSEEYWLPPLSRHITDPFAARDEALPEDSRVALRDSQTFGP